MAMNKRQNEDSLSHFLVPNSIQSAFMSLVSVRWPYKKKTDIICLSIRLINISDYSAAWYISNMFIDSSSGENPQTVLYTCQNTEVGNKYN